MRDEGDSCFKPHAPWTLEKEKKKRLCRFLAKIRFPDGFCSYWERCVDTEAGKLHGMKTHDCHILLQRILAAGLKGIAPKEMYNAIADLGRFFRELCARTLRVKVLRRLKVEIVLILCRLEKLPPAFFHVMIHLVVHLPDEAILRGPVHYGWMYPVERRLGHLKASVRNKGRPKGSIAEGYIVDECITFCSRYFSDDMETRINKAERNQDNHREVSGDEFKFFSDGAKGFGKSYLKYFVKEFDKMVWFVLENCEEAECYMK
jgi:hypothetical protein